MEKYEKMSKIKGRKEENKKLEDGRNADRSMKGETEND